MSEQFDESVLLSLCVRVVSAASTACRDVTSSTSTSCRATCPITQAGFVRIVSNPAFSPDAVSPTSAVAILDANLRHEHHRFWKDECGFGDAVSAFRPQLVGHRQVTDAYLLGLALRKRGCLATLDRGVRTFVRAGSGADAIHVIQ